MRERLKLDTGKEAYKKKDADKNDHDASNLAYPDYRPEPDFLLEPA